jgi:hypothetical protein
MMFNENQSNKLIPVSSLGLCKEKNKKLSQALVGHACHPKLCGRLRLKVCSSRPTWVKKFVKPLSQWKKLDIVICTSEDTKHKIVELQFRPAWSNSKTLSPN